MAEPTEYQLRKCLAEIAADPLCPLFIAEKVKRTLLNLPEVRPLDGCESQ